MCPGWASGLARVVQRAGALRWGVIGLLVAAGVVLVLHRQTLWNNELSALSPVSAADQALDASLRADLGAPDVRYLVVVSGSAQESVLRAAESVVTALQPLVQANAIAGVDSPTTLLPSVATQQARLASLPEPAELKERSESGARAVAHPAGAPGAIPGGCASGTASAPD